MLALAGGAFVALAANPGLLQVELTFETGVNCLAVAGLAFAVALTAHRRHAMDFALCAAATGAAWMAAQLDYFTLDVAKAVSHVAALVLVAVYLSMMARPSHPVPSAARATTSWPVWLARRSRPLTA